jgi:hypothetical protein
MQAKAMSNLILKFAGADATGFAGADIVARVQGYPSADNPESFFREIVVRASGPDANLPVDPGRYRIQAVLPSGAILQEDRTVAAGQDVSVIFSPKRAPRSPVRTDLRGNPVFGARPWALRRPDILLYEMHPRPFADWDDRPSFNYNTGIAGQNLLGSPVLDGSGRSLLIQVRPQRVEYGPRLWASITYDDVIESVSIPAPWKLRFLSMAQVELAMNSDPDGLNARTSVAVNDPQMNGLLAYLGRGNLGPARTMLRDLDYESTIQTAIAEKEVNPLAACAAAYVGLAVFDAGERERWDAWLPNIMRLFPSIPDGAIVHARRIINRPKSALETAEALDALKTAFRAGVPYFTAGLLLLRDCLTLFAPSDPEARRMLETASRFVSRLDQSQVFTVLQYPARIPPL